ncbi:glycosyltransferase family 2 protein [Synechococcus sp. L2F]|uniref:glycosyltransferase family 2 protein n=2 Tax=unclassified Synechococcus TaxID=2626047 RepID=UPI0020CE2854|nr:glycosyltransferase family 2 protein [Synechococcus sp. L2F]MCP9828526.1 glycosyltransferase family 2 protein [Synechococcus sp. L2F]
MNQAETSRILNARQEDRSPERDRNDGITMESPSVSVIIPCFNEAGAIRRTVEEILAAIDTSGLKAVEVMVVDDGSNDGSAEILSELENLYGSRRMRVIGHSRNRGYGAALKTGIRRSHSELICITDADGTYPNELIPELVDEAADHDMLVGARIAEDVEYSKLRTIPKLFLVPWVSFLSGQDVPDINSGFRFFRRDVALRFLELLPNGFSFTTTITICMLRNNFDVAYIPISYRRRIGNSHIQPIKDTINFVHLISRTGMYFAPLRLLLPLVVALSICFILSLFYDAFVLRNLTDKTILIGFAALNILMFAMLADMIDKRNI